MICFLFKIFFFHYQLQNLITISGRSTCINIWEDSIKFNEPILLQACPQMSRRTDDRKIDRRTNGQTERQTDEQKYGRIGIILSIDKFMASSNLFACFHFKLSYF